MPRVGVFPRFGQRRSRKPAALPQKPDDAPVEPEVLRFYEFQEVFRQRCCFKCPVHQWDKYDKSVSVRKMYGALKCNKGLLTK